MVLHKIKKKKKTTGSKEVAYAKSHVTKPRPNLITVPSLPEMES